MPTPVRDSASHFLTVQEVAAELRVSTMTIHRLIAAGELRGHRIGRSIRIPVDAVSELLAK